MKNKKLFFIPLITLAIISCQSDNLYEPISEENSQLSALSNSKMSSALTAAFGDNINLNNLANYADQEIPSYILQDNTSFLNPITDRGATLGRVLFYDKNLSSNNTVSCASCHKQELAFGDNNVASQGVNGNTGRHSMRLINARFSLESRFFWDERAATLETQTTMPVKDHIEMGFSGANGDLSVSDLITRLKGLSYYQELFTKAYGSVDITERKIQNALAQFIRSITSFDSKYDQGRANVFSDFSSFSNFTLEENLGKKLFMEIPILSLVVTGDRVAGGLGCAGCHGAPEFSIAPISSNNGIINIINSSGIDINVTKSPSLRDLVNSTGASNGPMMHSGLINTLESVVDHYNNIPKSIQNPKLDIRLAVANSLRITEKEKKALVAFLKTLSGKNVYIDKKWSNPFINQ
ncbi:cytochrome-c peroxidase [Chryseobacterium sp. G0201]|uniref:cytochrome-c peroxidase n=1 Tax=Chryseobacterium sp. G0201 TaxID=2487065 RepID=UPI000F505338|nr:cytochrome c peroxidase [Chryseobacterium sp. G0201]AZA55574.1 cytochrome-c peroxidase [Chryseobacterium sp. G0201]